jgi:hypothetical protein
MAAQVIDSAEISPAAPLDWLQAGAGIKAPPHRRAAPEKNR